MLVTPAAPCALDEWDKDEKMMKDELFAKIAAELAENKQFLKRVNLYRDGEPLLDRKLFSYFHVEVITYTEYINIYKCKLA